MRMTETSAQLQTWVESESWIRYNKSLRRLTAKQRELLYELGAKELGYGGAEPGGMQLMGAGAYGFPGDYTVAPGSYGSMPGRPAWEDVNSNASDELQAEAERIASDRGEDLADLARNNPELAKRIYAIAEATVQYRGAQPSMMLGYSGDDGEEDGEE